MLRDVGFQYSKTNIWGDTSRFLRNYEDFISNQLFVKNPVGMVKIFHKTFHFVPFGMSKERF